MASIHFSSSLPCLAAILIWTITCGVSIAAPCATSQAIVRREVDMTQAQVQAAVEVKLGLSVMQRLIDINLEDLPVELYGGSDTKVHERGLRGFAMLYQYTLLFSTLEKLGLNSTDLTLFRVITEQILTDACNWITSYDTPWLDCSDQANFVAVLLALGLNSHIDQLDCYLETTTSTSLEPMRNQVWVNRTLTGDYEHFRCPFCTEINLKSCCA